MSSDPLNPHSSPSSNPLQKVEDKVSSKYFDVREMKYNKENLNRNVIMESIGYLHKIPEEIERLFFKPDKMFEQPSLLSKLKVLFLKMSRPPSKDSKMADKKPGRPMLYPYTFTAKIAQFPLKFYFNNNWMWKYYFLAVAVSFPIFYKIGRMSNTPENVKKWEEIRRREFTPGGHH